MKSETINTGMRNRVAKVNTIKPNISNNEGHIEYQSPLIKAYILPIKYQKRLSALSVVLIQVWKFLDLFGFQVPHVNILTWMAVDLTVIVLIQMLRLPGWIATTRKVLTYITLIFALNLIVYYVKPITY